MADPLWINADAGAPAYSANDMRQAMALALAYDGRLLGARQGVRPGGDQLLTSLSVATITVKAGVCCIDPGLSTPQGPYWVAIPADETHTLQAADATNPRKDITIARVHDHDEDASGLRLARTEYLVGVPAASPVEPAVPVGAIRLATIDVPASGGGSAAITDRRPYTVATGGILPVRAASDIAAGVAGRYRDRLDTAMLERDSGAAWVTVADPAVFTAWMSYIPAWTASVSNPAIGNGTIVGKYKLVGKTCHFYIIITMGTTTTYGSGYWSVTLPTPAAAEFQIVNAQVRDASAGNEKAASARLDLTKVLRIHLGDGAWVDSATIAWTSQDVLMVGGTYEAA